MGERLMSANRQERHNILLSTNSPFDCVPESVLDVLADDDSIYDGEVLINTVEEQSTVNWPRSFLHEMDRILNLEKVEQITATFRLMLGVLLGKVDVADEIQLIREMFSLSEKEYQVSETTKGKVCGDKHKYRSLCERLARDTKYKTEVLLPVYAMLKHLFLFREYTSAINIAKIVFSTLGIQVKDSFNYLLPKSDIVEKWANKYGLANSLNEENIFVAIEMAIITLTASHNRPLSTREEKERAVLLRSITHFFEGCQKESHIHAICKKAGIPKSVEKILVEAYGCGETEMNFVLQAKNTPISARQKNNLQQWINSIGFRDYDSIDIFSYPGKWLIDSVISWNNTKAYDGKGDTYLRFLYWLRSKFSIAEFDKSALHTTYHITPWAKQLFDEANMDDINRYLFAPRNIRERKRTRSTLSVVKEIIEEIPFTRKTIMYFLKMLSEASGSLPRVIIWFLLFDGDKTEDIIAREIASIYQLQRCATQRGARKHECKAIQKIAEKGKRYCEISFDDEVIVAYSRRMCRLYEIAKDVVNKDGENSHSAFSHSQNTEHNTGGANNSWPNIEAIYGDTPQEWEDETGLSLPVIFASIITQSSPCVKWTARATNKVAGGRASLSIQEKPPMFKTDCLDFIRTNWRRNDGNESICDYDEFWQEVAENICKRKPTKIYRLASLYNLCNSHRHIYPIFSCLELDRLELSPDDISILSLPSMKKGTVKEREGASWAGIARLLLQTEKFEGIFSTRLLSNISTSKNSPQLIEILEENGVSILDIARQIIKGF